jgi:hemerythrin
MAITWSDKLATGNSNIDNQHQELFRRFDILLAACNQRKAKEEIHNLLLFLGDYVKTHFSMEEALQKKHDFPGYPDHKKEHDGFILELQKLEEEFQLEGASCPLIIQTNQTMIDWLINHINKRDKEMAIFLRSNS